MFDLQCSPQSLELFTNICHLMHQKGLVSGSGGNASLRVEGGFLITGSGVPMADVAPENLVLVHPDGSWQGPVPPSKEAALHRSCYAVRPQVGAVVHVHSVYAVALSCLAGLDTHSAVPVYTPGFGMRVGHLPAVPYLRPGSPELAAATARILADRDSVLLCNHGLVTVGATPEDALNLVEEIEENAKIHFLLGQKGLSLTPEQVRELAAYS